MSLARAALLGAVLALPASAGAVDWLGARLPNGPGQPWPYAVDGRKAKPAGIDRVQVQSAFQAAFQAWQDAGCSYLTFDYQGADGTHGLHQPDGFNVMGAMIENRAEDPEFYDNALGGGGAVAAATPLFYGGTIYECDVGLNAVDYPWGVAGEAGKWDLKSAALHESGHCLGLDHTSDPKSVMYSLLSVGELRRGLTSVDVANVCSLYPKTGQVGSPCSGSCPGGLSCVGSGTTAFCSQGCDPAVANACPVGFSCSTPTLIAGQKGTCTFGGASSIKVGAPCERLSTHEDCGAPADAMCLPYDSVQNLWADGYCTADCGSTPCPASSHCYDLTDGALGTVRRCLKDCRPGTGDCRFDYACEPVSEGLGRCRPACHSDGECPGQLCRACDGLCVHRGGAKAVGESCAQDSECPAGGICRKDLSGGTCVIVCGTACTLCPQGSSCLPHGDKGELFCFKSCAAPADCRLGQGCFQEGTGSGCKPACVSDTDCAVGIPCVGGSCMRPAGGDAGCLLCDDRDGGAPPGPDAAQEPPPLPKGCGCGAGDTPALGAALCLASLLFRRRTRCRT